MVNCVTQVHYKSSLGLGGWEAFIKRCKFTPNRVTWGAWTIERIDEMVRNFAAASKTSHLMPTNLQLREAKAAEKNLRRESVAALTAAIQAHGGFMLFHDVHRYVA